ncbi:MAG: serine hydrolase domain-containing protein [Terricaulis sp.]
MIRRQFLAGTLAVSACQSIPSAREAVAANDPAIEAAIRAYFDPIAARHDLSGALRIERGGKTTEVRYGFADWAAQTPIDGHTRFAGASITKSMTATILLKLAEQGLIDRGASVSTYLPEFQHGGTMTLDHVMSHKAGLPRDVPEEERAAFGEGGLTAWLNAHPPTGTPGETEAYSNVGYEVLGLIVMRASGKSYETLAQEIIFAPLGMTDTSIENQSVNPRSAKPHVVGPPPSEVRAGANTTLPYGPAGVSASLADFMRWSRAVRDGTIVQLRGPDGHMTGSVLSFEEAGKQAQFLQGTIRGSGAGMATFADDDAVVAFALNLEAYPLFNAQRILTRIAFGIDPGAPPPRPAAVALTPAHRELVGTYENGSWGQLKFYDTGEEMRITMLGIGVDHYLTPASDGRLVWRGFNFTFSARRDAAGAINGVTIEQQFMEAGPEANEMNKIA